MKKRVKGRKGLAWLLSAAMTVTLMPSAVFAADDSQEAPKWKDGTYQSTAKGFGGDVTVEIVVKDGKIVSATSPAHSGESFWDVYGVDQVLRDIVTYQKADVDTVTGATYSSNAVISAAGKALESAKIEDSSEESAEVHYAKAALYDSSFLSYAGKMVYDNTFVNPSVTYTIDGNGDYVFKLTLRPAEDVQANKWDTRTFDFTGQDFEGIRYATPYTYQNKVMTEIGSDETKGTKTFRFVIPGDEVSYLSRVAFQLTFDTTSAKQTELGSAWPLSTYMGIDLSQDEAPASYVLMNIPYAEFYAAEDGAVDSVTSATLNGKARNVNVNGASYHQSEAAVSSEGIAGAMYPVKVKDADLEALQAKGAVEVTDAAKLEYEMTARGQTSTVTLEGAQVLQESPTYSYYILAEEPASYKELTLSEDGTASFGKATGTPETGEATGEATIGARHADIEIPLSGVEVTPADVSGVVVTTDSGSYALHHVVNIWRGTELGWNLSDLDLGGQTITKIRYFLKDGSIKDYTANIPIASAGYVLMNIPYADFYKAELGETDAAVDAVTSSTLNKPRTGTLAGGSYHKNADGSDISGVIYPVFVKDVAQLEGLTEITDASSVTITVTNRGTTTETTYEGKDALFESADYSYYKLDTKPARYKTMTVEDGTKSFSAVSGRATTVTDATGAVNEAGHHADVEIQLSNTTGIEQGQTVSGAVVTFDDGSKVGLRHVSELWRATEIGGTAEQFAGKTITNVRYYTQDSVIDFPMEIKVKEDPGDVTAAFTSAKNVKLTGLPEDLENPVATVQTQVGRGETPTVIADAVAVTDGNIATDAAEDGKTYAITVSSDNYLPIKTTADYTAPKPSSGGSGGSAAPTYKVTAPSETANGSVSASLEKAKKGDTVTITVDPEEGYEADTVTVKDKDGNEVEVTDNGDGTYSFTMPASAVSVEASFKEKKADQPDEPPVPGTHDNCPSEPFKDVDTSLWYHEGIDYVIANGLMKGIADDAFAPDATTTRAMIVTILYRLENEPAAEAASFRDVEAGSWYEAAVNWAAANGIVNGYDADTFAPTDEITREQIAAILYRYANFKGQDVSQTGDLSRFTDSGSVSDWAKDAMAWAVGAELVNGMSETTLVPQGSATRAQVATLMMRLCENVLK